MNYLGTIKDIFLDTTQQNNVVDYVNSQANNGQAVVNVSNGTLFTIGDQVIVYDGKDAFETCTIQNIVANAITMTVNLSNTYPEGSRIGRYLGFLDTTNNKFQRLVGPDLGTGADGAFVSSGPTTTWGTDKNFTSVTIQNGHTVYVQGNIVLKCQGTFNIQAGGKLSAKGQGHAGGVRPANYTGQQGASYPGNGGNFNSANGGGGGGGQYGGAHNRVGGGGGGGYATTGEGGYENGLNDYTSWRGVGGQIYNTVDLSIFSMVYLYGSGGGSGADENSGAGNGGAGGGIIRIHAKNLIVAGEIDCDGLNGLTATNPLQYTASGGGGGAGGTIFAQILQKITITGSVHANGGLGGYGWVSGAGSSTANFRGGNGGAGRIRIEAGKIVGTTTPTYATGYANNMGGFTRYGWYTTAKVKPLNKTFFANAHIKFYANVAVAPSGSVSSGQKVIGLSSPNALLFNSGMRVIIYENEKMEIATVDVVGGTSITVLSNLQYSYTTGATIIRIDARAYGSLVATGANENFQEMDLKEVANLGGSIWQLEFTKAYNSVGTDTDKLQFAGRVRLEGKDNDTVDVHAKDISWSYF